jgi:hypothetical protein
MRTRDRVCSLLAASTLLIPTLSLASPQGSVLVKLQLFTRMNYDWLCGGIWISPALISTVLEDYVLLSRDDSAPA